jgi:CDP-glucose 4,6-dehydratase
LYWFDKVYRNDNSDGKFIETDPLKDKDPYSASKVWAEAVVAAWQQNSKAQGGTRTISVHAGNDIGGDFVENRITPELDRSILISKKDVILRNPESTRPCQHVLHPITVYVLASTVTLQRKSEKSNNSASYGKNSSVKKKQKNSLNGGDLASKYKLPIKENSSRHYL